MTEVLHSPSHFPSSPSSLSFAPNDNVSTQVLPHSHASLINPHSPPVEVNSGGDDSSDKEEEKRKKEEDQLSLLALLVTLFRKSLLACRREREDLCSMEIGWPTDVRHVAHVTFDRFHGFLGLPVEFEPEVPRRPPSASTNVFGVSTESMQCSYDSRGNSVPTILLLMQRCLYSQGGLRAEGIFRINAENSQEEHVRDQLNRGTVPDGIDVHCLAGLIKAWFRELPSGVLDSLSPEQVMQCQSEEDSAQLVRLLPQTEAALLDWAINLMADVVQEEQYNKMNAHNIAMVFAPNMTQMADPLTALMYAVQVMTFLKTLILKTLREREDSILEPASASHSDPFDKNDPHCPSQPCLEPCSKEETDHVYNADEPFLAYHGKFNEENPLTDNAYDTSQTSNDNALPKSNWFTANACPCEVPTCSISLRNITDTDVMGLKWNLQPHFCRNTTGQSSKNVRKGRRRVNGHSVGQALIMVEKSRGTSIVSRINSRVERVEAWR